MRHLWQPVVLCLRYWPQLAACFLVGLLGRRASIELAAWLGHDNDLWASLIMPLAGIARLGSYVAMFFVLRPGIPVLAALPRRSSRQVDVFATVIVPFFAIYLAWQMFREDWLAYEARALDYSIGEAMMSPDPVDLHPGALPVSTATWVVIAAALVARYVLTALKDRLPAWFLGVRIYVDALWVFLVLTFSANQGLSFVLNPAGWLAQRRIVVWFNETRESAFSHFGVLETVWDAAMWALGTVFGGAAVPLLWLAVAGIVYGASTTPDWTAAARRVAGRRAESVRVRWQRVPERLRTDVGAYTESQLGKFKPIADSARILMHGGVLALSLYVLAYLGLAWLDMAGSFYRAQLGSGYLLRGMAWLVGPQSQQFWNAGRETLGLVSHLIVEPLRISLVAVTLGYCLDRAATAQTAPESPRPAP